MSSVVNCFNQRDSRNQERLPGVHGSPDGLQRRLRDSFPIKHGPKRGMGIQNRGHQLMSRGKLPHISRRASAMSSAVIWTLYSSSNPSKPFNGFAGAPFSRSDSTNSSTARCLSGGNSRSFSSTGSGIFMVGSVSILLRFPRSGNGNLRIVVAGLQTRAVLPLLPVGAGLFTLSEAPKGPARFLLPPRPIRALPLTLFLL